MCGIIFVKTKDVKTTQALVELQFRQQIARGTQGFGIVEVKPNIRKPKIRRALHLKTAMDDLFAMNSAAAMFHHRIPTSTGNTLIATHPFRASKGGRTIYLIHNGVLNNEDDVLEKLSILPHTLQSYSEQPDPEAKKRKSKEETVIYSYNDSEALANDFVDALVTGRTELYSKGDIACLAYEPALNCVWVYRNSGNPLRLHRTKDAFMIASLAPGKEDIKEDTLFKFDIVKGTFDKVYALKSEAGYNWYTSADNVGSYDYHDRDSASWSRSYEKGRVYDGYGRDITDYRQQREEWEDDLRLADADDRYDRARIRAGDEGKLLLPQGEMQFGPNGEIIDDKPLGYKSKYFNKTDLVNPDPKNRWFDGTLLNENSRLGRMLKDETHYNNFVDEYTHPQTFASDIQNVDCFYDLIERIRYTCKMLDEMHYLDKENFYCDGKSITFLKFQLILLMNVYYKVSSTYSYVERKEKWIQDVIGMAELKEANIKMTKPNPPQPHPVTVMLGKKKPELIGFKTEGMPVM